MEDSPYSSLVQVTLGEGPQIPRLHGQPVPPSVCLLTQDSVFASAVPYQLLILRSHLFTNSGSTAHSLLSRLKNEIIIS